jgi:hypothetical protein
LGRIYGAGGVGVGNVDPGPGPGLLLYSRGVGDAVLLRLNGDGYLERCERVRAAGNSNAWISDVAVDGQGDVYASVSGTGVIDLEPGSGRFVMPPGDHTFLWKLTKAAGQK